MVAKKKQTKIQVVFSGQFNPERDMQGSFWNVDMIGEELDDLMEEAFEKGWLNFVDSDGIEHYVNLDGVDEIAFW